VAAAISAAALQVVSLFVNRDAMRKEQIKLDEEASTNLVNAKLIQKVLEESPQKEKSGGLTSGSKRRRLEEEAAMPGTTKVAQSESLVPPAKKGDSVPSNDGKGPKLPCIWDLAEKLGVLTTKGTKIVCTRANICQFPHVKLGDLTLAEAKRRMSAVSDKGFREGLKEKINESKGKFKK
jgi:hypothetical protein